MPVSFVTVAMIFIAALTAGGCAFSANESEEPVDLIGTFTDNMAHILGEPLDRSETSMAMAIFAYIDSSHSCSLRAGGAVECWGDNVNEQSDAPAGFH